MLLEIVDFILAGEGHVACRGDNLDFGRKNLESEVEAHLVVTGAGAAVSHIFRADALGIVDDGDSLENTLRADRDRVSAIAEHIAHNHIFDTLVVVFVCDVERGMSLCPESKCTLLDALQLIGAEATGVGNGGINLITAILAKIFHAKRCVETTAEC